MTTHPPSDAPRFSRRGFLRAVGRAGVTLAALPLAPSLPSARRSARPRPRNAQASPPNIAATDRALHAARRLTYGPTPELLETVRSTGVDAFIEEQLAPASLDDSQMDALLADFQTLDLSNAEIFQRYRDQAGTVVGELTMATFLRAVYSRRQLYELMVEFWTNHFNIYIGDGAVRYLKTSDDRDVIRAHALGRFADLLLASAQSPAMLFYLDNYLSRGDDPNENYARELMELHTVGVDGGYTEEDIRPAALCLTGWTFSRRTGQFEFRARQHDTGPLQVMAWSTDGKRGPEAVQDGIALLDYLAHHPSTARHLAYKLCVRFVSDTPPADLVESAAQVYLDNDTAITPVLRHIFSRDAFWQSAGQKFRRPYELVAAGMRILDARPQVEQAQKQGRRLRVLFQTLGQLPFGWHPPNGYPDVAGAWLSTGGLLARWNFIQYLVANRVPGAEVDIRTLLDDIPATAGALVDALADRLLFTALTDADREALLGYLGLEAAQAIPNRVLTYKAPQLVALLLNSTYFQYR